MNGIKNGDASNRSLSDSQFRWRAAFPNEPGRAQEQGSRTKMRNGGRLEPSQPFNEERPMPLGLNLPSSVLAAYDGRGLQGEQPQERRRSDPSGQEQMSTFILYDHSGKIISHGSKRNGGTVSERPRHQDADVKEREYQRRPPEQVAPHDRRPTSPPRPLESALVKHVHPHQQQLPRPPVQPSSAPQLSVAPLELQPAPLSNNLHIHPVVLQNSASALAPIRTLYEQAWFQTVSNVQNEMTRMHNELVDALDREHATCSRLMEENRVLQQDLERIKADLRNARRDSEKFKGQYDRLIAENESLRQAGKDRVAQRSSRDDQVREATRLYIDEQLDQLKTQYGEQMEKQRAEAERTLEEQKVMFERERRELHKIAHERNVQRSGSESGSTLVASDTEKVMSPFCDRGLDGAESIHYDRPRGHHMSVSSGTKSPTSSPQLFSESLSRRQPASYHTVSPYTPSIPPKEVFPSTTSQDVRRDSNETDNVMVVDIDLSSPATSSRQAPDTALSAIPSTSTHHRPVSQSPACPARHMSSSRSPSIPLASILPRPLTSSPLLRPRQDQSANSVRLSSLPAMVPPARSRHASLSNRNAPRSTPPMGCLGPKPSSRPPSRPASRPVSPNGIARPTLKVDVSPVIPPIAVLEELNRTSRQQQELAPKSQTPKTGPQSISYLPSPAQIQSRTSHSRPLRPATSQFRQQPEQQPRSVPLPPQQLLPTPAQPSKQPMAQSLPPPPPPPPSQPQPPLPPQNSHKQQPHQQPQHAYQNCFPVQGQAGTWVSYPYSYDYPPPVPIPALQSTSASASASSSFSSSTQRKRDRVEYEEDSGSGERARVKVKLEDTSGGGVAKAAVAEVKEVKKTNKIGITHMDLLYETRGAKMICRMCRMPGQEEQKTPTAMFPVNAKWAELIGHCQSVHPKSCADLEKLSPSQVQELRQRMQSGKLTGYTLKG